jgi:hypothetical protein
MGESKISVLAESISSQRAPQVVPTTTLALKNTVWPALAVNV